MRLSKQGVGFYLVLTTGVHWADAIFHLPELCTKTTVVPSCDFSFADLVVRVPVRMTVSPNRLTDTLLNVRSVCGSRFDCLPALAVVFDHTTPIGSTSVKLSISNWSIVAPSPLSKALNHLACRVSSSERRLASVPWARATTDAPMTATQPTRNFRCMVFPSQKRPSTAARPDTHGQLPYSYQRLSGR